LLKNDKHQVDIFEKSRGAGGRCSTKYIQEKLLDHGAPYFQGDDEKFVIFCEEMVAQKKLIKKENHYYPIDGMNKLCGHFIDKNDLKKETKIIAANYQNKQWKLTDENGACYDNYDQLILTIPAPQILQMEIELDQKIKEQLEQVTYNSIASLLVYSSTLQNLMNPKLLKSTIFKKVVDNSSKYNYNNFSSYVIHLSEEVSNMKNFSDKKEVEEFIVRMIYNISGINLDEDFHLIPHIWRYAFVDQGLDMEYLRDQNNSLGIIGDYFGGKNIQSAYLSAHNIYAKEFAKG
jgi:renalase